MKKDKKEVLGILRLKMMKERAIYLGNTFIDGGKTTKEFTKLEERVQNRLGEWSSKLLSKARKVMLIK